MDGRCLPLCCIQLGAYTQQQRQRFLGQRCYFAGGRGLHCSKYAVHKQIPACQQHTKAWDSTCHEQSLPNVLCFEIVTFCVRAEGNGRGRAGLT